MIVIKRTKYDLLLSFNPCELFEYFEVDELHGLKKSECYSHRNTKNSSYIAGLCNLIPTEKPLIYRNKYFVFINLNRCNSDLETFGHIFHELMHLSINLFNENLKYEEQMISYCENESKLIFPIIKEYL